MGVERLGRGELGPAVALLARAFADDPVLTHLVRPAEVGLVLGALCRDAAAAGLVEAVRADGGLAGVAVWLPPGAHPPSPAREGRLLPHWARLAAHHPRAVPRLLRAGRALDGLHPDEPHWFLSLLGVEPALQRRGIGAALLEPGLARAVGAPVHLDTGRPENVPWYRRFGFEVTDEVRAVPTAPPSWGCGGPGIAIRGLPELDAVVSECLHSS